MTIQEADFSQAQALFEKLPLEQQKELCKGIGKKSPTLLKQQLAELQICFRALRPGAQADLRKNDWQSIELIPAYYMLKPPVPESPGWQRAAHFLAVWEQLKLSGKPGDSLGTAIAKTGINERRLFQLVRSESPTDLEALRRILQQKPPVTWEALGMAVFYWNDRQKQQILKDYFLAA